MGCFLACFGSSKDRKRRKQRHGAVQSRDQRKVAYNPVQSAVSTRVECPEKPISQALEIRDKPQEQLSLSPKKKVTFDSNVKTYEHVSVEESTDFSAGKQDSDLREAKEEEGLAKPNLSHSSSEDGSVLSSVGSYPPNHRYQNCRESDDELDYEESDVDKGEDDDDEDEDEGGIDYDDIYEDDGIVESMSSAKFAKLGTEENDFSEVSSLNEREMKLNRNVRDRNLYAHPVLNPVENLTQWKAVKAKGTPPLRQQKENLTLDQEHPPLSSEPSFRESPFSFKTISDQPKKSNQEIAVDASLSNWLGLPESTPINKPSSRIGLDTISPEKTTSFGSNSPRSFDDRPILGALTLEELKQFSPSPSPRKSPNSSRDDEMPIIGSVGTYWNHSGSPKDSGSVSSYKGIPNTTSKYREDKRVNWHSTPFETRLERALNGRAAGAGSTHT